MFAVSDLSCNSGLYLLLDTLNDWLIDVNINFYCLKPFTPELASFDK